MSVLEEIINDPGNNPLTGMDNVGDWIGLAMNVILGTVLTITVMTTIVAGIQFMASRGDPKSVDTARKSLTYSVIAVLLTVGAITIKTVIANVFGVPDELKNVVPNF